MTPEDVQVYRHDGYPAPIVVQFHGDGAFTSVMPDATAADLVRRVADALAPEHLIALRAHMTKRLIDLGYETSSGNG